MKKLIVIVAMLLTTTQFVSAVGNTPTTTISYISVYPNATIIKVANAHTNVDGCTFSRATEFLILPTDGSDGSKVLYSALLSAYVTGTKVVLGYNGCNGTFPNMIRLDFVK